MIERRIKKEIINNWSNHFIDLSIYSQNKIYKIIGSFILGIEILSIPRSEKFRPIFVCYPLWRENVKKCLDEPIFTKELHNNKGFQLDIPFKQHDISFREAVECTKIQAPILSEQKKSIKQVIKTIDEQFSQILIKNSPVGQAKLFEAKLMGALYVNDINIVEEVLNEIKKESKTWKPNLFEWKFGKVEEWIAGLEKKVNNRDDFINKIEINKKDKKLSKLKQFELLL